MEPIKTYIDLKNFFGTAPNDILKEIFLLCPQLSRINKKLNLIAEESFKAINKRMISLCPSLIGVCKASEGKTSAQKLFMILVKNLHDRAKAQGVSVMIPSKVNRLEWECQKFRTLAIQVNEMHEFDKEHRKAYDFMMFVKLLAYKLKLTVDLKDILDPNLPKDKEKVSLTDLKQDLQDHHTYNQELWKKLIENEKIAHLKNVNLCNHNFRFIPPEIGQLSQLEHLCIGKNQLENLPDEISQLMHLKSLQIGENRTLEKLPAVIFRLSQLEELYIIKNENLKELSVEIGKLKNLKQLSCAGEQLHEIPVQIGQLTQLNKLNLKGSFQTLPKEISDLLQLNELKLSSPGLERIPPEIVYLTQLKEVEIQLCTLQNFPEELCSLFDSTSLSLVGCEIKAIPKSIGKLKNLKALYLGHNPLEKFPEEICTLSNLEILGLNKCKISKVPGAISKFPKLKELYLHNNPLESISSKTAKLPLEILSIHNHIDQDPMLKLKDLPVKLQKLYGAGKLNLYSNLTYPPKPRSFNEQWSHQLMQTKKTVFDTLSKVKKNIKRKT